jgi:hypothetical protein
LGEDKATDKSDKLRTVTSIGYYPNEKEKSMATIPNKVKDRLTAGIKRFQHILSTAKSRDVNESDTVIIVTDILSEVLGFDKYSEITSEYVIRNTFVDLAIKLDGTLQMLLEVKAI